MFDSRQCALIDSKKSYVRYISHELRTPLNSAFLGDHVCNVDRTVAQLLFLIRYCSSFAVFSLILDELNLSVRRSDMILFQLIF